MTSMPSEPQLRIKHATEKRKPVGEVDSVILLKPSSTGTNMPLPKWRVIMSALFKPPVIAQVIGLTIGLIQPLQHVLFYGEGEGEGEVQDEGGVSG